MAKKKREKKEKAFKRKKLSIKRKTAPVKNKVKGAKATKAGEEERRGTATKTCFTIGGSFFSKRLLRYTKLIHSRFSPPPESLSPRGGGWGEGAL